MPRTEDYLPFHPWTTPEPHGIPGYTGYLPGYGPKRMYQMVKTYGKMTHDIMSEDPVAGKRLAPLGQRLINVLEEEEGLWERENTVSDVKRRYNMVSGYDGYIPRKMLLFGKRYNLEARAATEDYERILQKRLHIPRILPVQNVIETMPASDLEEIKLKRHRDIPKYASYMNPMNYNENPFNLLEIHPKPKYIPGYKEYLLGKVLEDGTTFDNDPKYGTPNCCFELSGVHKRPAMANWFCNQHQEPARRQFKSCCDRVKK